MGGTYYDEGTSKYIVSVRVAQMTYFFMFRLILCSAWLGTMIAVGVAFVALSNKETRKSNLFRLQCTCVLLTILYDASEVGNVSYRLKTLTFRSNQTINYDAYTHWTSAGHFAEHFIPVLADAALLFRISSFFPFPVYSKRKRLYIFAPFWFLLISRAIVSILVAAFYSVQYFSGVVWVNVDPLPYHIPPMYSLSGFSYGATVELAMGSLYCTMASSILIFKAYQLAKSRLAVNNKKRVQARMRFFAEALLMCCIPPIFISIAAPIQLLAFTTYSYYRESLTLLANTSVIFSILATSWSSIRADWTKDQTYVSNTGQKSSVDAEQLHQMTIN
ncbi:uncharacterized protein FA14DRAFT_185677 [Meira miltonrushii]|uniref:G protein-coupled receptor n=1 Tax=Meira miltonrushii TaxID=1280837 RepID=A0A316V919_9BASI|nr:uncharacterized protein FA14DRAFT_185677 [Meira miltonrushii]PWN32683.1 hypothetical protein FA14DRAFT_185677 [Meira miltonrushii]